MMASPLPSHDSEASECAVLSLIDAFGRDSDATDSDGPIRTPPMTTDIFGPLFECTVSAYTPHVPIDIVKAATELGVPVDGMTSVYLRKPIPGEEGCSRGDRCRGFYLGDKVAPLVWRITTPEREALLTDQPVDIRPVCILCRRHANIIQRLYKR